VPAGETFVALLQTTVRRVGDLFGLARRCQIKGPEQEQTRRVSRGIRAARSRESRSDGATIESNSESSGAMLCVTKAQEAGIGAMVAAAYGNRSEATSITLAVEWPRSARA